MKIANITPIALLEDALDEEETFHLILTQLVLSSETYRNFYRERIRKGDFVVLDNDAFEKRDSITSIGELKRAIELLDPGPSEVILPDEWGSTDHLRGVEIAQEYASALNAFHRPSGGYMAVPRAGNWDDYLQAVVAMLEIDGVSTIGIPEMGVTSYLGMSRGAMLTRLRFTTSVPVHLLGVNESLEDLMDIRLLNGGGARSVDTSKFVRWGLDHTLVTKDKIPPYPGRGGMSFFDIPDLDWNIPYKYIHQNIKYWREAVSKHESDRTT